MTSATYQAGIEPIMEKKAQLNPFVKLALDFGPLILFFVVNGRAGIFWATGVFMAAVVVALLVSYVLIRRFPIMTMVTAVIVVVFGGLTIVLQNDIFVKMKTDDHLSAVRGRALRPGLC